MLGDIVSMARKGYDKGGAAWSWGAGKIGTTGMVGLTGAGAGAAYGATFGRDRGQSRARGAFSGAIGGAGLAMGGRFAAKGAASATRTFMGGAINSSSARSNYVNMVSSIADRNFKGAASSAMHFAKSLDYKAGGATLKSNLGSRFQAMKSTVTGAWSQAR